MNESIAINQSKKAARIQTVVCGFLFSAFSFTYLYVFQPYVIEALHFSLAHGKTRFVPLASAVVITFVLLLLRWAVNIPLGLKGPVRALAYFPSFLLLGALGDVGRGVYMAGYSNGWIPLLPVVLGVYCVAMFVLRRWLRSWIDRVYSPLVLVNSNLCILLALAFLTVRLGNADEAFHHEVEVEYHLRHRQFGRALQVGRHSQEASRTLTVLRAYAMAHTGQLGERLFTYPQPYRSEGLYFAHDSLSVLRYTNDSICSLLGARPYSGAINVNFLRSICYKETGKYTALEYYLSALLLDKRLDDFVEAIPEFYEVADSLPRSFKEALVLYEDRHPGYSSGLQDSTWSYAYAGYRAEKERWTTLPEQRKAVRAAYEKTYWWYFDFQ